MTKFIDLTGQRFGKLVIIERTKKPEYIKYDRTYWLCKCDCGKSIITNTSQLRSKRITSCGCNSFNDLTGDRFGKLLVIKRVPNNKQRQIMWLCQCDCGKEKIILGKYLLNGHKDSCGCDKKEHNHIIDLTGKKFGQISVIEFAYIDKKSGQAVWKCICDCGNETFVRGASLRNGDTRSCGHTSNESNKKKGIRFEDLTNNIYGKLKVIKMYSEEKRKNGKYKRFWLCRCDCGSEIIIEGGYLKNGHKKSCGCAKEYHPRLEEGEAALNELYGIYLINAGRRGFEFLITKDIFKKHTKQNCYYCGCEPKSIQKTNGKRSGNYIYNGIDRINSDIGYIDSNIVACCETCNKSKRAMSQQDFLLWIERVYNHSIKGKENNETKEII